MKLKKLLLGTALTAGTVFAVGTTSANADEVYTIQSDDTLAKISKQFVGDKSLIDSIVDANGIQDKNVIYEGEQLTIPTNGNDAEEQQAPVQEPEANAGNANGSVQEQFLAAGGTEEMWNNIVMPESSGNPNAQNPAGYQGLGQTMESWGTGSVEEQTTGMINYAQERYGSVEEAIAFRDQNNWW